VSGGGGFHDIRTEVDDVLWAGVEGSEKIHETRRRRKKNNESRRRNNCFHLRASTINSRLTNNSPTVVIGLPMGAKHRAESGGKRKTKRE
jgi:hypothetical protein